VLRLQRHLLAAGPELDAGARKRDFAGGVRQSKGTFGVKSIFLAAAACVAMAGIGCARAQTALPVVSSPSQAPGTLTPRELEQLVAPVALYPDQVLADVLAAATYPAEVVEAARFVANPARAGMKGAALAEAAAGEDWDASVKALLMFPQVLQMMDSTLDWTEHLGHAFIAQQADVMQAVQQLRLAAEQAGTLASGPYESVVNEGGDISISPASQQDVYVPSYQAQCVFGPDPACDGLDTQLFWASDVLLPYGYVQWGFLDWRQRELRLGRQVYGGGGAFADVWRHASLRPALPAGGIAGNPGHFNSAPAAQGGGFAPRYGSTTRFKAALWLGPRPQRPPAFHAAPAFGMHTSGRAHR